MQQSHNEGCGQAMCVTRFDQSECVICRVIFALKIAIFRGVYNEIFALFQACVGNFDTIPPWRLLEHFFVIAVALLLNILLS